MKTLIALRCPRCGADINVADDREFIFCEYCGSKILLDNDHEYTIHTIDEAKIRKVEADREVSMRRVEAERDVKLQKARTNHMVQQQKIKLERAENLLYIKLIIGWILACVILLIVGIYGYTIENAAMGCCIMLSLIVAIVGWALFDDVFKKRTENRNKAAGLVQISKSNGDFQGMDYRAVENELKSCGFKHIDKSPLHDIYFGVLLKPGRVASVMIDGKESFSSGDWFSRNATVNITYHSKANE